MQPHTGDTGHVPRSGPLALLYRWLFDHDFDQGYA